jgi:hypothetical protein
MNLQFLLPDCPGFGVYQLDTGSLYSIININSSLKLIRGICGRLSMIPLSLKLIEQDVLPEGKKKTIKILSLTAPYSIAEIQKYAQIPPGQALLLPVPDCEAPDDLFPPEVLKQQKAAKHDEEVEMAFTYVMNDPRYKSGTRIKGGLTTDVKRFIVEMYEKATGKKLLPGG